MSIITLVKKFWKILLVIMIVAGVATAAYFLFRHFGLTDSKNLLENLRQIVDNSIWGAVVFSLILILQVIFIPAGTMAFTFPAAVIFESPVKAWLICWFSLAVGSWIMFWLARKFGTKILKWIVGTEKAEKYAKFLGQGKFVLPLLLLVPIFPDDIICVAAGISNINWLYFMIVIFITRGIDNFCTVFIGSSLLKTTEGIIILVIFAILMIIASYFLTKYKDNIENFFLSKFTRKKKISNENAEVENNNNEENIKKNIKNDIKNNKN
ncbi:MAG: TVP38/TMEM64 family protein [Clostridia bacterium]|nr:TVP38/TMEM64 family protein [Clostridia bacterium]